jgi:DNA repair protein RecO (recombination protein O)
VREEEAIVLDTQRYRESDLGVTLLTASGERLFAYAPGAARSRRRFGGTLQPGSRVQARWRVRREGALPILEETSLVAPPPTPDPLDRYYAAAHVLEVAGAFAREGERDERLFRLVGRLLERLGAGDDPWRICLYAEAWTLRLAGLMPETERCAVSGESLAGRRVAIAPETGATLAEHGPPGAFLLGPEGLAWIEATRRAVPEALPPLVGGASAELARLLGGLIVAFTERPLRARAALDRLRAPGAVNDSESDGA